MLVQYTAAALASENKSLVHPASADTIPTSANWEDHVSNGPIAARQARRVLRNVETILAIELLAAAQGIDFRREVMPDARSAQGTAIAYELIRQRVPFLRQDAVMYPHHRSSPRAGSQRHAEGGRPCLTRRPALDQVRTSTHKAAQKRRRLSVRLTVYSVD